jgi:hypothetical protein
VRNRGIQRHVYILHVLYRTFRRAIGANVNYGTREENDKKWMASPRCESLHYWKNS